MSQKFWDKARKDLKYVLNSDTAISITVTPTTGGPIEVQGQAFVHSTDFDENGMMVINENSHVNIFEKDLLDQGLQTRNSSGYFIIEGWVVEFKESNGTVIARMATPKPTKTFGMLTVYLKNIEQKDRTIYSKININEPINVFEPFKTTNG